MLKQGDKGEAVKALQKDLRRHGHELVIDGEFGLITRLAVERFQATSGIAADGLVGEVTSAYLRASSKPIKSDKVLPSVLRVAPWLSAMRGLSGTREIPGARSNPLILSWVRTLGARYPALRPNISWYKNDDTPWCGLAMAEAVGECDPGYHPPLSPLLALNWKPYGSKLDWPTLGAILVARRKGGGHDTLYESEDSKYFYGRGGNQSNSINVARLAKSRVVAMRWPVGALVPIRPIRVYGAFANATEVGS